MSNEPTILIELKGVSHEYAVGGHDKDLVLSDINLSVAENDVVVLLGPSGCGKSTLIRIMAGLIIPTRGTVLYRGSPLPGVAPGVAMVFQNFALFPWLTVRHNVLLPVGSLPPD
ncbi:MAG: ATP-binding cassette domain-containing protein, partial [Opitutaceae bacterium]